MTDENDNKEPENVVKLENPIEKIVMKEGPLKQFIVNYVGNKLHPQDDAVTLQMVVNTVADEFPEFVLALAEENFIRGYQQAMQDMDFMNKQQEELLNAVADESPILEGEVEETEHE